MQTEIKLEWDYTQSPNEVWEYLTQADLIALWLMPNDFKAVLGQEFQFRVNPIPSLELDGIFHCQVLEMVQPRKLVYSWKGGPGNDVFTLDTIIEWTLEQKEKGTRLFLKQTGFNDKNLSIFTSMNGGWKKQVQKMIDLLNTSPHVNAKP
jgi:uncharacterized protein YndB with AHSA1/START domain